jgi:hypothetical protein
MDSLAESFDWRGELCNDASAHCEIHGANGSRSDYLFGSNVGLPVPRVDKGERMGFFAARRGHVHLECHLIRPLHGSRRSVLLCRLGGAGHCADHR